MTFQQTPFSNQRDVATEFDQWAQAGRGDKMAAGHRYATEQLITDLAIPSNAVVLDAGCGIGWVLNDLLGRRIARGVGIDLSEEMIAIAASRRTLPHITFQTADSAHTPFEQGEFSHIISIESIYYTPQPLETLSEWLRVCRPGGCLGIVIDPLSRQSGRSVLGRGAGADGPQPISSRVARSAADRWLERCR
ncbi:MAG: class I SAM-dependent methyltransferase [Cyanobacteria bacterium P01_D01_bin.14]